MSALGLDAALPWEQARDVAARAGQHRTTRAYARLDEAAGSVLATDVVSLLDDPDADSAATDGFAFRGEGPWTVVDAAQGLQPGDACAVRRGDVVPHHTDAVLAAENCHVRALADGRALVTATDALTGLPDDLLRPSFGTDIVRAAQWGQAGRVLAHAGSVVTPAVIAAAAAAGHEELEVLRPPVVGVLVLGARLLDRGLPRDGRVRDALGAAVTAFVGALGARGNPAVRAPDTEALLLREIDDAAVDVLITTGATDPGAGSLLRRVLRDLGAHWLVDGVMCSPGAQVLLVRLPDGRLLLGLPGTPTSALAAVATIAPPLIGGLRGDAPLGDAPSVRLSGDVPPADVDGDTVLVPARVRGADVSVAPDMPGFAPSAALAMWAHADAIAVVPAGRPHEARLLDACGRPWGPSAPSRDT